jgi:hypothetical protein
MQKIEYQIGHKFNNLTLENIPVYKSKNGGKKKNNILCM